MSEEQRQINELKKSNVLFLERIDAIEKDFLQFKGEIKLHVFELFTKLDGKIDILLAQKEQKEKDKEQNSGKRKFSITTVISFLALIAALVAAIGQFV